MNTSQSSAMESGSGSPKTRPYCLATKLLLMETQAANYDLEVKDPQPPNNPENEKKEIKTAHPKETSKSSICMPLNIVQATKYPKRPHT